MLLGNHLHTSIELINLSLLKKYSVISIKLQAICQYMQGKTMSEVACCFGYCRQVISLWLRRYNKEGIDGLFDRFRSGQPKKLSQLEEIRFKQRINQGVKKSDKVSAFTGKVIQSILIQEFNAHYSLNGVYNLLKRLNLSSLLPRPRHEKNNLQTMQEWKENLPKVISEVKKKSKQEN